MKMIRLSILFLILITSSIEGMSQQVASVEENVIELKDLQNLLGKWNGTLTYIDYSSGEPFSMPSNLEVQSKKTNRKLILSYEYPNESQANDSDKLRISKNKSSLNGKPIVSRTKTVDGDTKIVTEHMSKDANRKALIRNVYIIGASKFIMRKEVQFEGSDDWLKRNEYNFKKK